MLIQEMLSSLDIHLLSVGRTRPGPEWNFLNVNSFYSRLLCVLEGEAFIRHHGREYRIGPNELHLVPCYTSADYFCPSRFDHYYVTFTSRAFGGVDICSIQEYEYQRQARRLDIEFLEQLLALNPSAELPVIDPALARYRQYHEERRNSYHDRPPEIHLDNMAFLSLLLSPFLATGKNISGNTGSMRLSAFYRYVEENLHRPITIQDLAEHLGMTPNYLSDWLSRNYRFRPVEYINRRRVEEAQQHLIVSRKSIKEICHEVGFSSVSYFSRVFRKQTGMTATQYRSLYEQG